MNKTHTDLNVVTAIFAFYPYYSLKLSGKRLKLNPTKPQEVLNNVFEGGY